MTTPMHPGQHLAELYLFPLLINAVQLSAMLEVSEEVASQFSAGEIPLTADMALRLEIVFSKPATEWMDLQVKYDLACAKKQADFSRLVVCTSLSELWLTGVPNVAGHYLWREKDGSQEHRVEVFFEAYGERTSRVVRCYSKTDFSFVDDGRGQWCRIQ